MEKKTQYIFEEGEVSDDTAWLVVFHIKKHTSMVSYLRPSNNAKRVKSRTWY